MPDYPRQLQKFGGEDSAKCPKSNGKTKLNSLETGGGEPLFEKLKELDYDLPQRFALFPTNYSGYYKHRLTIGGW